MSDHERGEQDGADPAAPVQGEPQRPPAAPWGESAPATAIGQEEPSEGLGPLTRDITTPAPEGEQPEPKKGSFLRELPILILIAFGLAMLIKTFFVQAFYIPSESMVPTLERDDRVLVNKIVYRIRDPRRGEIVVFVGERDERQRSLLQRVRDVITEGLGAPSSVEKDFIKRVIGLPGETIEVTPEGAVVVTTADGEQMTLAEPYLASHDAESDGSFGPFTVPANSYFVMGDNRDNSADSRSVLGPIDRDEIVGKAFVRIWPPSRFGFFRTPSYDQAVGAAGVVPIAALALLGWWNRRRRRR